MLYAIIEAFHRLGLPNIRNDDFFDRLSRRYSIIILGISFIIVTTTQFVGKPIHCFTKLVESQHKIDYVNWVCWISSSYYLPFDKPLPNRFEERPERIPYYQWVPFIIFIMLILFYIPGFIWRKLSTSCGLDSKMITAVLFNMDPLSTEQRKEAMMGLVRHIDKGLTYHRDYHHGFLYSTWRRFACLLCCTIGLSSGNFLAAGYILVKLLYILNAFGQLFLLNVFIGDRFHLYGFETLQKLYYGQSIEAVERFPRITMCQFTLRTLGDNIQKYDVQCLLPINIYNEKIFLFIWFWLGFVGLASVYGLFKWFHYFSLKSRKNFIRRHLKANSIDYYSANVTQSDPELLRTFVDAYCRQDGILLLRIVSANMNNVIVGDLICALWENWQLQRQIRLKPAPETVEIQQSRVQPEPYDGNQSTVTSFRVPISTIHEDRFMLSPLRL